MRDLGPDVDRLGQGVEEVQVLRERFPVPLDALSQGRAGNVLDTLHQPDQPLAAVRGGGREADAAVAEHDSRHAVPEGRREQRIPGDLTVEVGVDVDEAGCDQETVGVDFLTAQVVDLADGSDDTVVNRDIRLARGRARAVHDQSVANHEIVHVCSLCLIHAVSRGARACTSAGCPQYARFLAIRPFVGATPALLPGTGTAR